MDRNASSSSKGVANGNVILCHCNTPAKILKAWTDANPGRRFYTCGRGPKVGSKYGTCNFFRWFDMEKPSGWQYHALLEARDLIREQKDEIRRLKIQRNCEAERIDTKNPSEIVAEFLLNLSN